MKPATTELSSEQPLKMLEEMLTIWEFEIFAKEQMNAGKQGSHVTVVAVQVVDEKCFEYLEAPIERGTPPHAHVSFSPRWRHNTLPVQRRSSSLSGHSRSLHE